MKPSAIDVKIAAGELSLAGHFGTLVPATGNATRALLTSEREQDVDQMSKWRGCFVPHPRTRRSGVKRR